MSEPNSLMLQFLTWVAEHRSSYEETLEAWQSTCPRHTIWEDAIIGGLVKIESVAGSRRSLVALTARGRAILDAQNNPKTARADARTGT